MSAWILIHVQFMFKPYLLCWWTSCFTVPLPTAQNPVGSSLPVSRCTHMYRHTYNPPKHTHILEGLPINTPTCIQLSIRGEKNKPGLSLEAQWFYGRGAFERPAKQDKGLIWFIKPRLHPLFSGPGSVNQYPSLWIKSLPNRSVQIFLLHNDKSNTSGREAKPLRF